MAISFNNIRQFSVNDGSATQSSSISYVLASGPTFTARSTTLAADMFTDTAVTGDYMAFRRQNGCSKVAGIRVDIATAMVTATGHTITWEYRKTDGTWAAFAGVTDNTNNFTVVGQNSVTWTMPTDWGTNATAVNGFTGSIWWRARLTVNSTLSEGGRTAATPWDVYDYSVRVDANHAYDSGTATSGTSSTLTDTAKAWTTNILQNRILRIHTGTGAGTNMVIKSNTATVITFIDTVWTSDARLELALDNTSQYTICANFEDLYQANVAGGWGVIAKAGSHSYAFSCWLNLDAGAFGDVMTNVEFTNDFYFYSTGAATNVYPHVLGWRLPKMYGLDKAIMGNTIISNRTCPMDNRSMGFSITTEYAFSGNNKYLLRADYPLTGTDGFIRVWFYNYHKESIGDTYEGWRSVVWPKSSPKTEVRGLNVQDGYSGIEVPLAAFNGVNVTYAASLGVYLTSANAALATGFKITPQNPTGNRYGSPVQWFALTVDANITDYQGSRFRLMGDVFGSTGNTGSAIMKYTFRALVTDEQGNLLSNAKVQISDSLAQNRKTYLDFDSGDKLTAPNSAAGNQLSGCTAFSIEAWINQNGAGGGSNGRIIDKVTGTVGYLISSLSNVLRFQIYVGGTLYTSNTITSINSNWTHVVAVWDGSTAKLYSNNVTAAGTATAGVVGDDTGRELFIGQRFAEDAGWDGQIKRIRIFRDKALSAGDVATLWNNGDYYQNEASPVTGCTAEYNFTEGSGTTVADTSGNAVTATLGATTTAPTWVDTNAGDTSNALTTTTGTEGAYLNASTLVATNRYSATNQPTSPTRLRVKLTNYAETSASASIPARIEISGTDVNDFVITEIVFFEEFRNGAFLTKQEFKTIAASGIFIQGTNGVVTIDNLGIITPQTITCERWRTPDDVNLKLTDFNPIIIKVSRPGFEPIIIKRNIFEPQNLVIALKKESICLDEDC